MLRYPNLYPAIVWEWIHMTHYSKEWPVKPFAIDCVSLPQINIKLYLPCVKSLQRNYQSSHSADKGVFLSLGIFSFELICARYSFLWSFWWEKFNFCKIQVIKAVKAKHFSKCQLHPLAYSLLKSSILDWFV